LENELLLVLAFNNNNYFSHAHSFYPGCEEQALDFEPQLLHTNIDKEMCKFINLQHERLKNECENKDINEVVEN